MVSALVGFLVALFFLILALFLPRSKGARGFHPLDLKHAALDNRNLLPVQPSAEWIEEMRAALKEIYPMPTHIESVYQDNGREGLWLLQVDQSGDDLPSRKFLALCEVSSRSETWLLIHCKTWPSWAKGLQEFSYSLAGKSLVRQDMASASGLDSLFVEGGREASCARYLDLQRLKDQGPCMMGLSSNKLVIEDLSHSPHLTPEDDVAQLLRLVDAIVRGRKS